MVVVVVVTQNRGRSLIDSKSQNTRSSRPQATFNYRTYIFFFQTYFEWINDSFRNQRKYVHRTEEIIVIISRKEPRIVRKTLRTELVVYMYLFIIALCPPKVHNAHSRRQTIVNKLLMFYKTHQVEIFVIFFLQSPLLLVILNRRVCVFFFSSSLDLIHYNFAAVVVLFAQCYVSLLILPRSSCQSSFSLSRMIVD